MVHTCSVWDRVGLALRIGKVGTLGGELGNCSCDIKNVYQLYGGGIIYHFHLPLTVLSITNCNNYQLFAESKTLRGPILRYYLFFTRLIPVITIQPIFICIVMQPSPPTSPVF